MSDFRGSVAFCPKVAGASLCSLLLIAKIIRLGMCLEPGMRACSLTSIATLILTFG